MKSLKNLKKPKHVNRRLMFPCGGSIHGVLIPRIPASSPAMSREGIGNCAASPILRSKYLNLLQF